MKHIRTLGLAMTVLSLAGYAVGVVAVYPGRALTLVGVMAGVSLLAMGGRS